MIKTDLKFSALLISVLVFTGCTPEAMQLASLATDIVVQRAQLSNPNIDGLGSLGNSPAAISGAMQTQAITSTLGQSANAQAGMLQGSLVGAKMQMNPTMLGIGVVSSLLEKKQTEENKKSFEHLGSFMNDAENNATQRQKMMLELYNKQNGTNFSTVEELKNRASQ